MVGHWKSLNHRLLVLKKKRNSTMTKRSNNPHISIPKMSRDKQNNNKLKQKSLKRHKFKHRNRKRLKILLNPMKLRWNKYQSDKNRKEYHKNRGNKLNQLKNIGIIHSLPIPLKIKQLIIKVTSMRLRQKKKNSKDS